MVKQATTRFCCRCVSRVLSVDLDTVQRVATGDTAGIDPAVVQQIVEAIMALMEAVQTLFADCPAPATRLAAAVRDRTNWLARARGRSGIRRACRECGCSSAVAAGLAEVATELAPTDEDLDAALVELTDPDAILL